MKGYLSLRNVEYVEKNVSTDMEGRAELIAMGYDSTPVLIIGDLRLTGFDSESIDEALAEVGFAQS